VSTCAVGCTSVCAVGCTSVALTGTGAVFACAGSAAGSGCCAWASGASGPAITRAAMTTDVRNLTTDVLRIHRPPVCAPKPLEKCGGLHYPRPIPRTQRILRGSALLYEKAIIPGTFPSGGAHP